MKKYLLFGGDNYYPSGGWNDFVDSFDTILEAMAKMDIAKWEWDWAQIVNTATEEVTQFHF